MHNALFGGTLCLSEVSRFLSKLLTDHVTAARLLGWGEKRFSGAFRAGAPSPLARLLLARPFFLVPTTSKRLLRRPNFELKPSILNRDLPQVLLHNLTKHLLIFN